MTHPSDDATLLQGGVTIWYGDLMSPPLLLMLRAVDLDLAEK